MDRPFRQPQDKLGDPPPPKSSQGDVAGLAPDPQAHPPAGGRVRRSAHLPSALPQPGLPPLCPVAQHPARLAGGGRALVRPSVLRPPLRAPSLHHALHPRAHCGVVWFPREPWPLCVRGPSLKRHLSGRGEIGLHAASRTPDCRFSEGARPGPAVACHRPRASLCPCVPIS